MTVRWSAPPTPVKNVVLVTRVYKQNAGPDIITANVGPPEVFEEDPADVFTIVGSPVVIDVCLSPEDIASMDAFNADPAKRGWVKFTVSPFSGTAIASADVNAIYNSRAGHYQFIWDNAAVPDGIYKIEAMAFSKATIQGQHRVPGVHVALRIRRQPTGLVARQGPARLALRGTCRLSSTGTTTSLARDRSGAEADSQTWPLPTTPIRPSTTARRYYYKVRVVDTEGYESSFSEPR